MPQSILPCADIGDVGLHMHFFATFDKERGENGRKDLPRDFIQCLGYKKMKPSCLQVAPSVDAIQALSKFCRVATSRAAHFF